MRRRSRSIDTPEIPIAPMIDCVFLMLVYFMTTSSLERSEADLPFPAGQAGMPADPLRAVDEQQLAIDAAGTVEWNGSLFALLEDGGLAALRGRLESFGATCAAAGSEASLRIAPADQAPHQALVSTLDAATLAGIQNVYFP